MSEANAGAGARAGAGANAESEARRKILTVLEAIPKGVLYSTTDWHRITGEDKRELKDALDTLESEGVIEKLDSGRSDKPLHRLVQ
ncbi:MAG: hypothetical protein L0G70_05095 [Rubrobacter sp.]|nr:hypothetical protein [Rubrobacter sp.]